MKLNTFVLILLFVAGANAGFPVVYDAYVKVKDKNNFLRMLVPFVTMLLGFYLVINENTV